MQMRKVKLCFTLVGKTNAWERGLSSDIIGQISNEDRLFIVRKMVADRFGDRALIILNEQDLASNLSHYPEFFSAGWFISEDDGVSEMVVVEHADSMEAASDAMIEAVKLLDWDQFAVSVGE